MNLTNISATTCGKRPHTEWTEQQDRLLCQAFSCAEEEGHTVFYNPLRKRTTTTGTIRVMEILQKTPGLFDHLTKKQIIERYKERACPRIITTHISALDDSVQDRIIALTRQYGPRWQKISEQLCEESGGIEYLPPNSIKNCMNRKITQQDDAPSLSAATNSIQHAGRASVARDSSNESLVTNPEIWEALAKSLGEPEEEPIC